MNYDEYVIAKIYKLLFRYEKEQVKQSMVKWVKNFGCNIHKV